MSEKTYVCRFLNGNYVGNLISGPRHRSFVETDLKHACEWHKYHDAYLAATQHGAINFWVTTLQLAQELDSLSENQRSFLECVRGAGRFVPGGSWYWRTYSTSVRLAESLVRRGFLCRQLNADKLTEFVLTEKSKSICYE
jgi:hypothetical protein